jgi:hypothetical protein
MMTDDERNELGYKPASKVDINTEPHPPIIIQKYKKPQTKNEPEIKRCEVKIERPKRTLNNLIIKKRNCQIEEPVIKKAESSIKEEYNIKIEKPTH